MKNFQNRYSAMFRCAPRDVDDCPTAESLARFAAGRAWPWQRRRLTDHLGRCSDCADDYRVLAMARDGLTDALESGRETRGTVGLSPVWLRSGFAAAAVAGVAALGIIVLVETGGPGPWNPSDSMAANGAASSRGEPGVGNDDRLFKSNFGEPEPTDGPLFRDDFGG